MRYLPSVVKLTFLLVILVGCATPQTPYRPITQTPQEERLYQFLVASDIQLNPDLWAFAKDYYAYMGSLSPEERRHEQRRESRREYEDMMREPLALPWQGFSCTNIGQWTHCY